MLKSVLLTLLATLLFTVNVGIPVFEHICSKDGVFNSIIFKSNHCEQKQINLPSCCQKLKAKKNDCCHNETKIIKLKIEYTSSLNKIVFEQIAINEVKNAIALHLGSLINYDTLRDNFSGSDPPPKLSGRKILIKNQVFRI